MIDHIKKNAKNVFIVGRCGTGVTTLCKALEQSLRKNVNIVEYDPCKHINVNNFINRSGFDYVFFLSRVPRDDLESTSWGSWIEGLPTYTALVFEINEHPCRFLPSKGVHVLGELTAQDLL